MDEQEDLLPREDDGGESEYETASESDSEQHAVTFHMHTIVTFVPKPHWHAIDGGERRLEQEQRRLAELAKKRLEERRLETRRIAAEAIRREEQAESTAALDGAAATDDDEELDEAEGYKAWRRRELARIKRGRDEAETSTHGTTSSLTGQQRRTPLAPASKRRRRSFMHRHYHKGCSIF
ncbi:hypothetical protein ACP4OV_012737 [Aristida adscensionis]